MAYPLQGPLPHPRRRVALDDPWGVQADDQLRVTIERVDVRSECPVGQQPHNDSAKPRDYWHISLFLFRTRRQTRPRSTPVVTCVNQRSMFVGGECRYDASTRPAWIQAKSAGNELLREARACNLCTGLRTACTCRAKERQPPSQTGSRLESARPGFAAWWLARLATQEIRPTRTTFRPCRRGPSQS